MCMASARLLHEALNQLPSLDIPHKQVWLLPRTAQSASFADGQYHTTHWPIFHLAGEFRPGYDVCAQRRERHCERTSARQFLQAQAEMAHPAVAAASATCTTAFVLVSTTVIPYKHNCQLRIRTAQLPAYAWAVGTARMRPSAEYSLLMEASCNAHTCT